METCGSVIQTKIPAFPEGLTLVDALNRLPEAHPFGGECSSQAYFHFDNGTYLRVGVTDDDVGSGYLWMSSGKTGYRWKCGCSRCLP